MQLDTVSQEQYSFPVTTVIANAVVPTLIAGLAFLPRRLLPAQDMGTQAIRRENGARRGRLKGA
jgi:hypothetical protein